MLNSSTDDGGLNVRLPLPVQPVIISRDKMNSQAIPAFCQYKRTLPLPLADDIFLPPKNLCLYNFRLTAFQTEVAELSKSVIPSKQKNRGGKNHE